MLHTPATSPAVQAVPASGPGALPGFEARCPACGFTFRTAFRATAEADAREHVGYMLRKERRGR